MVEMQDTKSGVKGSEQKLNVTTIPHVITGKKKTQKQIVPSILIQLAIYLVCFAVIFHVYFKVYTFLSIAEC